MPQPLVYLVKNYTELYHHYVHSLFWDESLLSFNYKFLGLYDLPYNLLTNFIDVLYNYYLHPQEQLL